MNKRRIQRLFAAAFVFAFLVVASLDASRLLYTVTARPDMVSTGAAITVDWSALPRHSPKDWVGLYKLGDPDTGFVSRQYTGNATTGSAITTSRQAERGAAPSPLEPDRGRMVFTAPAQAGHYEFRYFLNDQYTRAATSNRVSVTSAPSDRPVGFASVNALGQNGTTGGEGGPTVTVSTAGAFLDYIGRPGPYVIRVDGMIALPDPMHNVLSHKTIVGLGNYSGFTGGGLNLGSSQSTPSNAIRNVILRNLRFSNAPDDCLNLQLYAHHIWIDHNDFSSAYDGALDIKRGADYVTVSWNHFHDQNKNMLLGHSDDSGMEDIGRLKVTFHHNRFDGTVQRNPRVRFGEPVHVFNNYYRNNTGYGMASQMNAGVVVEGNHFENVARPTRNDVGGSAGRIVHRLNLFANSGPPVAWGSVIEPSTFYPYTLDDAANVRSIVTQGAGVGRLGLRAGDVTAGAVLRVRRHPRGRLRNPGFRRSVEHDVVKEQL